MSVPGLGGLEPSPFTWTWDLEAAYGKYMDGLEQERPPESWFEQKAREQVADMVAWGHLTSGEAALVQSYLEELDWIFTPSPAS